MKEENSDVKNFFIYIIVIIFLVSGSKKAEADPIHNQNYYNNNTIILTSENYNRDNDKENQINFIKKLIKEVKEKIYTILKKKPEELTIKETELITLLQNEFSKNNQTFLEKFDKNNYNNLKSFKQYSDFREQLVLEKRNFLDFDLKKMEITFFKKGKSVDVEKISGKGRPGSWWETPPGLYYAQDKRLMVKLTLSDENNPIFMPNAVRFSGLFFVHRWPEYKDGSPLPGFYTEGCMRLNDKVSQKVYDFVEIGTPMLIYNSTEDKFTYKDVKKFIHYENAVSSKKYLIADLDNNKILLSKNINRNVYLGDVTKLIFMLAATEWKEVKEKEEPSWLNTVNQYFPGTRLIDGDKYTLLDLGSLLLSEKSEAANEEIADRIWGSMTDYMSWKSKSIGMKDFKYYNYTGNNNENTASMPDIFYLLKNIYLNRDFILDMSLNKAYNKKYRTNVFKDDIIIKSLWKNMEGFKGGITGKYYTGVEYGAGVFEVKLKNTKRNLAFIVFDSENVKKDVEVLKGFVKLYYND